MSSSLLDLPYELAETVFTVMDDKSLLAMRQVCKATKQVAEEIVINRTETLPDRRMILFEKVNGDLFVDFSFGTENLQSRLRHILVMKYLEASGYRYNEKKTHTTVSRDEIIPFFELLSFLLQGTEINTLDLSLLSQEMYPITSTFFEGKSVGELTFNLVESSEPIDHLLQFVGAISPKTVRVRLGKVISEYHLYKLAEIVDCISLLGECRFAYGDLSAHIFAFSVLSRRCSYLDVTDSSLELEPCMGAVLSHMLQEDIGDKPFYFACKTTRKHFSHSRIYNETRGNHVIEVTEIENGNDRNLIVIRHESMKQKGP